MNNSDSQPKKGIDDSSDADQPAPTNQGQNRRDALLKSMAFLPIPSVLAACGGGAEDGNSEAGNLLSATKADELERSNITLDAAAAPNAAANPATLVPVGTRMARLEIAFTTKRKVTVTLYNTYTGIGTKVGEKVATSSATHALHFGSVFFTNSNWAAGNLYLDVKSDTGEIGKEYKAYTDRWAEHEWSYFYRANVQAGWERIATVRFFPSTVDIDNFDFSQHVKTYDNTAAVKNLDNLEMTRHKMMPCPIDFPDRSARVTSIPGGDETLCLPDMRRVGGGRPFELLPVLSATSGKLRDCVKERLRRQTIHRSTYIGEARRRRLSDGIKDEYDSDENYLIEAYNELLLAIGGERMFAFIKETQQAYTYAFAKLCQGSTRSIYDFLRDHTSTGKLFTDLSKVQRVLKEQADNIPDPGKFRSTGGLSGSLNMQFAGSYVNKKFPFAFTGFGGRFSIALGRLSVGYSLDGGNAVIQGWPNGDSIFKLGVVGIIKGNTFRPGGLVDVDYDLEVTFNLNFKHGKCQLANAVFDPVFDLDTRGYVWDLMRKVYNYCIGYRVLEDIDEELGDIELEDIYLKDDIEYVSSEAQKASDILDNLGVIDSLASIATNTKLTKRDKRSWKTVEASPLRLIWVNKLADDTEFNNAYPDMVVAIVPGVKYILGGGYESVTTWDSDETVDFRETYYARITLTTDLHGVVTRSPIARKLLNYPDNS